MTDTSTELRKEIRDIIDIIPEENLCRLKPLLDALVDTDPDDVLSAEEERLLSQCLIDQTERPESFTPWEKVRNHKTNHE